MSVKTKKTAAAPVADVAASGAALFAAAVANGGRSDATARAYAAALRVFRRYCEEARVPADGKQFMCYLAVRVAQPVRIGGRDYARLRMQALTAAFAAAADTGLLGELNFNDVAAARRKFAADVLAADAKDGFTIRRPHPVPPAAVRALLAAANAAAAAGDAMAERDNLLLAVQWVGVMRGGAVRGLLRAAVAADGATITLRQDKNLSPTAPRLLRLDRPPAPDLADIFSAAAAALAGYTNRRALPGVFLFPTHRGGKLGKTQHDKIVKRLLSPLLPLGAAVSSHGLRRGAAQAMHDCGSDNLHIIAAGGWKSPTAVKPYLQN